MNAYARAFLIARVGIPMDWKAFCPKPFPRYIGQFMLLLNLNKIRTAHEKFEQVYPPEQLGQEADFKVVAPVELAFDIYKDKQAFRLEGTVKTTLELPCSRCLEPFTLPVESEFNLRYRPQTENAGDGEREIQEDDLTDAFYQHDEIDLGQLMREQFYLALPMKPLCSDACHGLCPTCGTNLNRAACDCKTELEDPRFAALRELRSKN